jgi:hypothetical protein
MINTIIRRFSPRYFNNKRISAEQYCDFYHKHGGSFILHPDTLGFIAEEFGLQPEFRGYFLSDICVCAIPTWGPYIAGDKSALKKYKVNDAIDFGYPQLYIPCDDNARVRIFFKSDYVTRFQSSCVLNARVHQKKCLSILRAIPEGLSENKIREFQAKLRRLIKAGGEIRDISSLPPHEIVSIYRHLFSLRWGHAPHGDALLPKTFAKFHRHLFGKVFFINGQPLAIQINYFSETNKTICIDYINGGVEKAHNNISPGSLLSYENGLAATTTAKTTNKRLIYNYGNADAEYKDRWCDRVPKLSTGLHP